jgi:hypothetical protein
LVLVILAVIWAAVLVPPYLQSRSENRPADSISSFRNQLSVLERRATNGPTGPVRSIGAHRAATAPARRARAEARKRQRDILTTLLIAAGVTLLLGLVMTPVLLLHVLVDALLGGYVYLLLQAKRLREERALKVRYLPAERHARRRRGPAYGAEPTLALRRSGS